MRNPFTPCVVALLFVSTLGPPAGAQSPLRMLGTNIKNSAGDAWDVWTSPVRGRPDDWLFTLGIFAGSAGVSLVDADVDRWALKQSKHATWSFLKPFREGGIAFSGRFLTPAALAALGVSVVTRNSRLQEGLLGCAAAYAASSAVRTYVIYPVIARTRPDSSRSDVDPNPPKFGDQYDINIPGSSLWGRHSFPGGHLVNVSACAAFLTRRYSMGAAEVVPWAVVGSVGVARMLDGRHWLSDQVVGAAFGYAVGKQFAVRSSHRANRIADTQTISPNGFSVAPDDGGVRLTWGMAF